MTRLSSAPALFNYVDARDVATFVDALLDALPAIPNAEVFFVAADDALAREPLAELLPRFVPGSDKLAAVLTGTAPAFSNAKARTVLGWRPVHHWRDELSEVGTGTRPPSDTRTGDDAAPAPDQTRKDVLA